MNDRMATLFSLPILMDNSKLLTSSIEAEVEDVRHGDETKELELSSLPKEKGWLGEMSLYHGFWYLSSMLPSVIAFQRHFEAHDQDIILVTKPKSGTTWLKSLIFTIVNRNSYTFLNTPLLTTNPHHLVPFLELGLYANAQVPPDHLDSITSPRLFSTHIPYSSLPGSIKASNCRIVYLCRQPLDILVSYWHFTFSQVGPRPIEQLLQMFEGGFETFGPFWDHVLEYWKQSLKNPNKVLFLRYENLKEDTIFNIKKLAKFVGFPFSLEEEREGVVEEISKICSLQNLRDLEVNKTGYFKDNFENKSFFRKGEVGDWANYFTPSVVEQIDKLMQDKFNGTGLTFKCIK